MLHYQIRPHSCGLGYHLTGNGLGDHSWTRTIAVCLGNAANRSYGERYRVELLDAKDKVIRVWEFPHDSHPIYQLKLKDGVDPTR